MLDSVTAELVGMLKKTPLDELLRLDTEPLRRRRMNEEQARALGNALWAFVIECRSDIAGVPC